MVICGSDLQRLALQANQHKSCRIWDDVYSCAGEKHAVLVFKCHVQGFVAI